MKLLLVTRGSQGDVYPYLTIAQELKKRGHEVTLSVPRLFEEQAKSSGVTYFLQAYDDISGMVEGKPDIKVLLKWTNDVIESQFAELIPMLKQHDMFICTNTEFAASSIAAYCGKPHIRTSYAPLLPGEKIPPAVFPLRKPIRRFVGFQWKLLNSGLNMMVRKTLNKNRAKFHMEPIKDQGDYAPANAFNYLLCSSHLAEVDSLWKYEWDCGGYCFNDNFSYNEIAYRNFLEFIKKDSRPIVFFTLGSCNANERDDLCSKLFQICSEENYRLIVGCGWWKVGTHLHNQDNLFLLDTAIPHYLVFPHCDALIHHGGSGTTHSAARSGKPQMAVPLIIDQFYYGSRAADLGVGPGSISIKIGKTALKKKVLDLVNNPVYKKNAAVLGEQLRSEQGITRFCDFIEQYGSSVYNGVALDLTSG
jgi:UDP:flavonoid glycosyltransferase YjiC (YdhE family)